MEVISLTSGKPLQPPTSNPQPAKETLTCRQSKAGTPPHRLHSTSSATASGLSRHGTSSGTTHTTAASTHLTRTLTEPEEKVLSHFCQLMFDSVGGMVVRSYQKLSGGLHVSGGDEDTSELPSVGAKEGRSKGILKNTTTDDSKEAVRSSDRKTVSFTSNPATEFDHSIDKRSNRLNSEIPMPPPTLCLVVSAYFSTPYILIDPSLSTVHSYLREVTVTLLAVLTKVTWWGAGGGGRTLYDVFKANGTVDTMQEEIFQAIQSEL